HAALAGADGGIHLASDATPGGGRLVDRGWDARRHLHHRRPVGRGHARPLLGGGDVPLAQARRVAAVARAAAACGGAVLRRGGRGRRSRSRWTWRACLATWLCCARTAGPSLTRAPYPPTRFAIATTCAARAASSPSPRT